MQDMNLGDWIDVVALFVLLWGFGRGFFRGPLREILAVVGIVVSFTIATTLYQPAYHWSGFDLRSGSQSVGYLAWFLILLGGSTALFRLADLGARKFTDKTGGLPLSSRFWGGGIAALKSIFLVLLAALAIAALPLTILGQRHRLVEEAHASRTVRFAESNEWIVRWMARTNLVGGLRSYLFEGTSAAMTESLIPSDDPEVTGRTTAAFQALLEEPDLIDRLGDSPTAVAAGARFEGHAGLAEMLATSDAVREADEDGRITLAEIQRILREDQETIEVLLADPAFRAMIASVDVERIRQELAEAEPPAPAGE